MKNDEPLPLIANMLMKKESSGTGLEGRAHVKPGEAIIESKRSRPELLERYNAPNLLPDPHRHWGINE